MFGDNKSVVDSSMQLNAKLHECHSMLSFHRVREAIAAGILGFYFTPGDENPADILSKHWGYTQIKERLLSLLFHRGDTANIKSVLGWLLRSVITVTVPKSVIYSFGRP
jgi:hypothetical protein